MSKTALITGAYRGLGFEAARQLLKKGYDVIITARKAGAGEKAAETLARDTGGKAWFVALDVTNEKSIQTAASEAAGLVDHLDVLINNAAIFPDPSKAALDSPAVLLTEAYATNTIGPLLVARAFAPLLKKAKSGARLINISSGLGALGEMQNGYTAYSLSKTALNAVTRQLAGAFADDGIAVNSVCPGWCRTEMGGANATRSAEEGAAGIVWLATEAPAKATGKFWRDRQEISW